MCSSAQNVLALSSPLPGNNTRPRDRADHIPLTTTLPSHLACPVLRPLSRWPQEAVPWMVPSLHGCSGGKGPVSLQTEFLRAAPTAPLPKPGLRTVPGSPSPQSELTTPRTSTLQPTSDQTVSPDAVEIEAASGTWTWGLWQPTHHSLG